MEKEDTWTLSTKRRQRSSQQQRQHQQQQSWQQNSQQREQRQNSQQISESELRLENVNRQQQQSWQQNSQQRRQRQNSQQVSDSELRLENVNRQQHQSWQQNSQQKRQRQNSQQISKSELRLENVNRQQQQSWQQNSQQRRQRQNSQQVSESELRFENVNRQQQQSWQQNSQQRRQRQNSQQVSESELRFENVNRQQQQSSQQQPQQQSGMQQRPEKKSKPGTAWQIPTSQQVSNPHTQQLTSQQSLPPQVVQPQACHISRGQLSPEQRSQQQTHMQSTWGRSPEPHTTQQVYQQGRMPLSPQQTLQHQTWDVPPQQSTSQAMQQQPASVSYPSTSTQQVLGVGDTEVFKIPTRRDPYKAGTAGTPIRVKTNMFEIIFRKDFVTTAMHYDIKIVPIDNAKSKKDDSKPKREIKNKTILRKIFEKWRMDNYPNRFPAYDGRANIFAASDFPFVGKWFGEVNIYDDERDENRSFEIIIKKIGIVDLSWLRTIKPSLEERTVFQTSIQVLDVILRHAPAQRLISVGKSLFPAGENRRVKALGSGLDLHVGGFLSAVIGWRPYLNIDVAHKAFVASENVVDIICDILQMKTREDLNSRNARDAVTPYEDKINKVLTGVKVNYAIPNQPSTKRTHRINGLGPNAINHKFDVKGKMCSIQEYFATVKNCKLNFPHLPCLWVGKRDDKTYLPAELCRVAPGQAVNRKLDESQTTQMIKYAATKTIDRIEKIKRAFNGICVNDSPVMQNEFHLEVAPQMKEVDARILLPPALQYNDLAPAVVNKGVWRAKRFSKPAKLENAYQFGMTVGRPQLPYPTVKPVPFDIERFFSNMRDLKLIIVILPDRTDAVYGTVKKISELRVGVLTQCIKMKNVLNLQYTTISNVLLKINSKLNGINHTFTQNTIPYCLRGKNYMLIGADVSHPSPDAKDIPSIAAVAASHDETSFKYNVTIRLQQPKQEEISDLKEIMIKHIEFYVKEMKMPPQKIIFYRDGVSEGQIAMVVDKEIKSIKDAYREYARERPGFNPQLTFIIVQKRHHIRLFPTRDQDSDDRNRNVKAGTIVDTEITHPHYIDFYLVSHASIQGTARPTKYRCICNESNFTEDHLEELTYHLCHMYARCTRSVSYPAPTYYAHLAAYRGRMWIQGKQYTEVDLKDKNKCKLEPLLKMPMSFI
ncbi:protein argonaute-2-like isoform X10 [Odontomachus brunneus]|uniref:protein argonaute-2-like isoform X10 n=1 Tax=Odontomachus brunneus TaxID=486640 RepID=UPI0013F2857A|nr:protein argonaute-2-like isoform X10 [Odontomachus brunneus]